MGNSFCTKEQADSQVRSANQNNLPPREPIEMTKVDSIDDKSDTDASKAEVTQSIEAPKFAPDNTEDKSEASDDDP